MTEHILIKKTEKEGKEMIELTFYGDYDSLFSLLYNCAKSNKTMEDLIIDVARETLPEIVFDEIHLN